MPPDSLFHDDAPHPRRGNGAAPTTLEVTIASSLAGKTPPERQWIVAGHIPVGQVTLLSGHGGDGKTLAALQLQTATATGRKWLGLSTTPCVSVGFYAEDEAAEIERRIAAIADQTGIEREDLGNMAFRSVVLDDNTELVTVDDKGNLTPTDYWGAVVRTVKSVGARLVILDASTNFFGGDEIRRRHVNAFIGLLRRLAIDIGGAVVLLAHPSNDGIRSGSGVSGSTHWHNSVRTRLYLLTPQGDDADPDERVLKRQKNNYGPRGGEIRIKWVNGAFLPVGEPTGLDRVAARGKARRVFLALLKNTYETKGWVSAARTSNNFAPTVFFGHPDREGVTKEQFATAMFELQKNGEIVSEQYGRPSEPRYRLKVA